MGAPQSTMAPSPKIVLLQSTLKRLSKQSPLHAQLTILDVQSSSKVITEMGKAQSNKTSMDTKPRKESLTKPTKDASVAGLGKCDCIHHVC
jgi:hypothetical protein